MLNERPSVDHLIKDAVEFEEEDDEYIEIIREGVIIEEIKLKPGQFNKKVIFLGRLKDENDIVIDNPSLSRYHAIIFKKLNCELNSNTFHLVDLNSTHGTRLNKKKMEKNEICPLLDCYQIRFGFSSRIYVVHTKVMESNEFISINWEKSKKLHEKRSKLFKEKLLKQNANDIQQLNDDLANSSGIYENQIFDNNKNDNDNDEICTNDMVHLMENEEENDKNWFLKDVRGVLFQWFESEGKSMELEKKEKNGKYFYELTLPLMEDENIRVDCRKSVKNKIIEKEVMEKACYRLSELDLLPPRQIFLSDKNVEEKGEKHENDFNRNDKYKLNDYYASDDDDYYDRTGEIERIRRKRKFKLETGQTITRDSLLNIDGYERNCTEDTNTLRKSEIIIIERIEHLIHLIKEVKSITSATDEESEKKLEISKDIDFFFPSTDEMEEKTIKEDGKRKKLEVETTFKQITRKKYSEELTNCINELMRIHKILKLLENDRIKLNFPNPEIFCEKTYSRII
ncbi:hypothetical protein SNEBB_009775 [Seison nebaliae]|nr:hypothetical protein SNEBB_009775 [Seison nebaliae]